MLTQPGTLLAPAKHCNRLLVSQSVMRSPKYVKGSVSPSWCCVPNQLLQTRLLQCQVHSHLDSIFWVCCSLSASSQLHNPWSHYTASGLLCDRSSFSKLVLCSIVLWVCLWHQDCQYGYDPSTIPEMTSYQLCSPKQSVQHVELGNSKLSALGTLYSSLHSCPLEPMLLRVGWVHTCSCRRMDTAHLGLKLQNLDSIF